MNRMIRAAFAPGLLTLGLILLGVIPLGPFPYARAALPQSPLPDLASHVTVLEAPPPPPAMPSIVHPGGGGSSQGVVPAVSGAPGRPGGDGTGAGVAKAGTGFFVGADGTLLTAAHVVQGCARVQILSQYVTRSWVSVRSMDLEHDIAVLKATDQRPPGVASLASGPPAGTRLFILGYPANASMTVAAETPGMLENQKFPSTVNALANPRDMLWLSAPAVTHGYSGGPVFDPRTGAVVGMVKGLVDGGYLRLIRDMPTTGIAIGPGLGHIGAMLRREAPYAGVSLAVSAGGDGIETLRRATVHVLCWQ